MGDTVVNLGGVERELSRLGARVESVDYKVDHVSEQVDGIKSDMDKLRRDFINMMEEQRRASALEQATTELVSVRQEMDKKFGNYSVVRNTMVGILQATDAALVRKATISTVSEELMISTPDYWLAPVLVALAAWINNNRDLADRAIREAVKRDNEHTSLAMALICRRNQRTSTCYEWLSRYFSTQDAARIDRDSMVYIDAYINGIFGPDEGHRCDAYMSKWISQIKVSTPNFEQRESKSWAEYFEQYKEDEGSKYPALKAIVQEFGYIDKYLGKVDAIDAISKKFNGIQSANVDHETLAARVDKHLMELVNSDDPKERALRAQEEYLLAVKACGGDVTKARKIVNYRDQEKRQQTMNIVEQMSSAVRDQSGTIEPYKKKTAMQFLGQYINNGFNIYRGSESVSFPEKITLTMNGWSGYSTTGNEGDALKQSYKKYMEDKEQGELGKLQSKYDSKNLKIAAIVCAVLAVVCIAFNPFLLIVFAAIAAALFAKALKQEDQGKKDAEGVKESYSKMISEGCNEIDLALLQWKEAKTSAEVGSDLLKLDRVA